MRVFTIFCCLFLSFCCFSQQVDSVASATKAPWTDAKKATIFSAVIPGAGQIYNNRWWKAGIVYAGGFGLAYMFKYNSDSLSTYQTAYAARIDGDPLTVDTKYGYLQDNSVKSFRDFHRRNRDIAIVGFVALYALQVIDANVDAHLKEFRVNKDLSMRIDPVIMNRISPSETTTGLRITFTF